MTESLLREALTLYTLTNPQMELIRHNENMTYKITDNGGCYVLRIHKPVYGFAMDVFSAGYDRLALIKNELEIIFDLKNRAGLSVQTPVRGNNGQFTQTLKDGTPVTMLEWVDGETVEKAKLTTKLLYDSGKLLAVMHKHFRKQADSGKRYVRYTYDQAILSKIKERIENAARAEAITGEQERTIMLALDEMKIRIDELDNLHEKQIVHADLMKSNMIVNADGRLTPIDFSLCGYSHIYMDIACIYGLAHDDEGRKHIIEGYKSVTKCDINPRYLEPYIALGVVLFIAWQYERAKDNGVSDLQFTK